MNLPKDISPIDILNIQQVVLDITATEAKENLTYEQVCRNLKFYCGWNPKTVEGIEKQIASGLPQLTNVKVKVHGFYVKITFSMPDGTSQKYQYK